MFRNRLHAFVTLAAVIATTAAVPPSHAKWPPWISIEAPVNPYDPSTRGAALLVHTLMREGIARVGDVTGTAEGLVGGARKSVALHFDSTGRPGVFALRPQWPTDGTWVLRISLYNTTALVSLDAHGQVAATRVPTQLQSGIMIPRAVADREIDSTLAAMARR